MELTKAQLIAADVVWRLYPWCERCEIAGSIRRKKPEVKDIEIVCIPDEREILMFNSVVASLGNKMKGGNRYIQIALPEGINIDLFLAREENYGLILAIRTGSARYSHEVLARGWVRAGFTSKDGMLVDQKGNRCPITTEEGLFQVIGVPYARPEERSL